MNESASRTIGSSAAAGIATGALLLTGVGLTRLYSYTLFHSLAELLSVAIAFAVFAIFWNTRRFLDSGCYLLLGTALAFVALIDLLHALAYKGVDLFQEGGVDLPTQLWIAARTLQAGSLVAAPLLSRRVIEPFWLLALYLVLTAALLATIFGGVFPSCLTPRGLTPFKVAAEYGISAVLLVSAALFVRRRRDFDREVFVPLVASVLVTVVSELLFTLYRSPEGPANLVGHLLKIVAFLLIYRAMIEVSLRQPYNVIFRELKQREEALRHSEQRFRTVADYTYDWEYWLGPDGVYLYISPSCERITGYSAAEFEADPQLFQRIAHPDDRELLTHHLCHEREHPGPLRLAFRIRRRDGEDRWIEHVCQPVKDAAGRPMGRRGNNRDMTEHHQAEEAAREAQAKLLEHQARARAQVEAELAKAEEQLVRQTRLAAIGRISASIAHDLRNPLAVIRYAVAILRRSLGNPEKSLQHLETIDSQVDVTNRIIDNLMEMARAKEARKESVDVGHLLEELLARMGPCYAIECERSFECEPFVVQADPIQLRQVLGNLLDNAVQAMGERGRVHVRACRGDGFDQIVFADEGPGVPAELRGQIFEPLVSSKPKGTGLGLAICRQIIERHGGSIALAPAAGQGAAFEIRLPRAA